MSALQVVVRGLLCGVLRSGVAEKGGQPVMELITSPSLSFRLPSRSIRCRIKSVGFLGVMQQSSENMSDSNDFTRFSSLAQGREDLFGLTTIIRRMVLTRAYDGLPAWVANLQVHLRGTNVQFSQVTRLAQEVLRALVSLL